jgi:sulfatase maturation enzyme AslB (radical SAM superfamily)
MDFYTMDNHKISEPPRPFTGDSDLSNADIPINHHLKDRFCSRPWEFFEIGLEGYTTACCPAWLPKLIGKLPEDSVQTVWNSESIQEIRESILDGSFKYCRPANCIFIASGTLPKRKKIFDPKLKKIINEHITIVQGGPKHYNLAYDESCNLSCPSCRTNHVNVTDGPEYDYRQKIHHRFLEAVFDHPHKKPVKVNITGAGDPFGSKLFRNFLTTIEGADYPNVVFDFQTNGVMFTKKYYKQMSRIKHNIGRVAVSFDAAKQSTYAITRRGGDWDQLLENMLLLNELRQKRIIKRLSADYVVQALNYREMPEFVDLLDQYRAVDTISFSLINNWGSYSADEFKRHAIWQTNHPEFSNFLKVLCDPALSSRRIFWGNVYPYRVKAIKSLGSRSYLLKYLHYNINRLQSKISAVFRNALV